MSPESALAAAVQTDHDSTSFHVTGEGFERDGSWPLT